MKSSIPILIAVVLIGGGCARDEARYELVRTESGVIRLDRKTGEMIAVSQYNVPRLVDVEQLREGSDVDPILKVLKAFPDFNLPGTKKVITAKLQYRWLKGRVDYRITLTPYFEELNGPFRADGTQFTILLTDSDGFDVHRFDVPFRSLVRIVGPSGKPEQWQVEDSFELSKADFQRIVGRTHTWVYSDALENVLNEEKAANQSVQPNRPGSVTPRANE